MPKVKRKCKNCGKEFETCRSFYANDGEFRWQNVACSPECGAAYLAAVLESRSAAGRTADINGAKTPAESEEEDEQFEDDFESGDSETDIET